MIKKYNNLSFIFFVPGMMMQIAAIVMVQGNTQNLFRSPTTAVLAFAGTVLAFIGFGYYAMAKGRSIAWGLVAIIGLPGLLILAILKDRSGDAWNT